MVPPTAITGSYPRPLWFDRSLDGRSFKAALGDSLFREQYLDAVAAIINAQEAAGLDIVTDGDSRFDLVVGGKSWFFYPIERLERALPEMILDLCDIMNAEFRELAPPVARQSRSRNRGIMASRPGPTAATLNSNFKPQRSTASSTVSMPRSGSTPAGAIPQSVAGLLGGAEL